jgi:hypothetical protein
MSAALERIRPKLLRSDPPVTNASEPLRAGYLTSETVSVGVFVHGVQNSELFLEESLTA